MDGKVATLQAMVEPTVDGHFVAKWLEWFEQFCRFKLFTCGFRKELFALKAEQVTDGDETACTDPGSGSHIDHRSFSDCIICDGGQNRDCQCSRDGFEHKTTTRKERMHRGGSSNLEGYLIRKESI